MGTVSNAPRELSSFVGRAEELAALNGAVLSGRALTLVGPGGCGKTRLALRVADRWEGEAWWVGLDDLAHSDDVADRVAGVLGVAVAGDTGAAHALVGELRGRELLLVLDNCEHVLEGAASMVAALLGACPGVAVLATSRHALEVPGERVTQVLPLSLPDALALFLERAGLDSVGSADVRVGARRVCDRLDRLPLALELAAAWTTTLTPQQIADSLTDPYALLDRGARTAPFRQRTLEESMRWSHELLGHDEKVLFRRLSVLEPGFDAAAAALAGLGDVAALRALRGLVGASLVVADTSGTAARYRMLATVNAYAQARLAEAGEVEATRDAHLNLYVAAVAALAPLLETDKDTWRARVGAHYGNVRAAIEWGLSRDDPTKGRRLAAGLAWLWHLEQRGQEGLRLLRRSVDLGGQERTALQAESLVALALVADTGSPGGLGYAAAQLAREIADEVGAAATSRLARSLTGVGLLGVDLDRARAEAARARRDAIEAGDAFVADASAALLGLIHLMRDEYPQAIDLLAPAAQSLLSRGDRGVASSALCWLATATAQVGHLDEAERLGERAVQTAAPLRELHRTGLARAALAEIQVLRGRTAAAAATLAPLDAVADGSFIPGLERAHAHLALADGRPREALDWLRRERTWLPGGELAAPGQLLLARALRQADDPVGAIDVLDSLLAATAERPAIHAAALTERGVLTEDGLGLHHEALSIRSAHGLLLGCIDSLEAIAAALVDTDDRGVAAVLIGAAARARAEHGYHGNVATAPGSRLPNAGSDPGMDLPGAIALAQRARGPRRRPATGWDSLTPTEKSVVELAAQGLSNPDIATRLYIGRGTVKTHLAHVYAKLGVANRTDLTRLAVLRDQAPR